LQQRQQAYNAAQRELEQAELDLEAKRKAAHSAHGHLTKAKTSQGGGVIRPHSVAPGQVMSFNVSGHGSNPLAAKRNQQQSFGRQPVQLRQTQKNGGQTRGGDQPTYKFDNVPAHEKDWLMKIVKENSPINPEAELELAARKRNPSFRTAGPRTFLLTVGGMGAGKGYSLSKFWQSRDAKGVGKPDDFVTVDPDEVRQGSAAFKAIIQAARSRNLSLPKDLISNSKMFNCTEGRRTGKDCSWIQLTHAYNYDHMKPAFQDPEIKTSLIYDSACASLDYCKGLLQKAAEVGFERLVVMWVHVDLKCSIYRAVTVRPGQQGRWTTADNCEASWEKATENAPLLVEEAKKLVGHRSVNSWMTILSRGSGTNKDEHGCDKDTELRITSGRAPNAPKPSPKPSPKLPKAQTPKPRPRNRKSRLQSGRRTSHGQRNSGSVRKSAARSGGKGVDLRGARGRSKG